MINITNEDNMELMARYPDKYFDLAIVDPPYGINMDNIRMGRRKGEKKSNYHKKRIGIMKDRIPESIF
jgi:site-specific DNA-methyltransferase (adenine-specific)